MAIELQGYRNGDSYRVTVLVDILFSSESLTSRKRQI